MKSLLYLTFVIFFYGKIFSQNIISNIHWSRIEYDSLQNPIAEKKNHFDMYSFSFNSKDSLIYWPIADCYLFAGSLCPFTWQPESNKIKIDFYRNIYSVTDSNFHKKQFSRTYHYDLIPTEIIDSNRAGFEFANRFHLTSLNYILELKDITDGIIIQYQGMMYKQDKAFKKMQRKISRRNKKRNRKARKMSNSFK